MLRDCMFCPSVFFSHNTPHTVYNSLSPTPAVYNICVCVCARVHEQGIHPPSQEGMQIMIWECLSGTRDIVLVCAWAALERSHRSAEQGKVWAHARALCVRVCNLGSQSVWRGILGPWKVKERKEKKRRKAFLILKISSMCISSEKGLRLKENENTN